MELKNVTGVLTATVVIFSVTGQALNWALYSPGGALCFSMGSVVWRRKHPASVWHLQTAFGAIGLGTYDRTGGVGVEADLSDA